MKNTISIILVLILCLSLSACSNSRDTNRVNSNSNNNIEEIQTKYFEAKVIEIYDNSVLVEPVEGSDELKSADRIVVTMNDTNLEFNLIVGDIIGITYGGEIAESSPAQITNTTSMVFVSAAENNEKVALIPMVMINDQMYYDTGRTNNVARCGVVDGEITSSVESWERPVENNQSNFGSGFEYQVGMEEGTIEIYMNDNWCVFEARGGDGSMIQYNGKWYDKSALSESTLKWLELSETERMLSSYYPPEFVESNIDFGVVLGTKDVTPKGLTLVCTQSNGNGVSELSTGSFFIVEHLVDDSWVEVEKKDPKGEIAWTAEAWMIPLNDTVEWPINWEFLYGELKSGDYRIGKEIMNFRGPGDYDKEMVYVEFTV